MITQQHQRTLNARTPGSASLSPDFEQHRAAPKISRYRLLRIRCRQGGFSLNEAMISLTVLSSGLLALAQFQGEMHENSSQTKTQTTAVNLAQEKLEELRGQAITDFAGIDNNSDNPAVSAGDNSHFQRRWTVTPHSSPDYKEVSVTTSWESFEGEARAVTMTSFLTEGRPYLTTTEQPILHVASEANEATDPRPERDPRESPDLRQDNPDREASGDRVTPILATCLCQRIGNDDGARLDTRNTNPDCKDSCCQSAWGRDLDAACEQADCGFVAQCLES